MYEDYDAMKDALARISKNILKGGIPKSKCPMVFAVTGSGRVSQGILEVLEQLPHEKVSPEDLPDFVQKNRGNKEYTKKIVISTFVAKDLVRKKDLNDKSPFDKAHYYKNPQLYESVFH